MALVDYKEWMLNALPGRLHPLVEGVYYTVFPDANVERPASNFPGSLPAKHVTDATVLPDRKALLGEVPENGVVAELGVDKGDFSKEILSIADPKSLYLIDQWGSQRYNEDKMEAVRSRFCEGIDSGDVEIVRDRSEVALADFEDGFFDWIYIDTTHSYEQTQKELAISKEKVKEGGMILGHDFCVGNPRGKRMYGVIPAVYEFCVAHDWKLSYLTVETDGYWSFGLEECA